MHVEVIYALPSAQHSAHLELAEDATVATALAAVARLAPFSELDLEALEVAVFGRITSREARLRHGDRVEILRPLAMDPKDARRERAQRSERT